MSQLSFIVLLFFWLRSSPSYWSVIIEVSTKFSLILTIFFLELPFIHPNRHTKVAEYFALKSHVNLLLPYRTPLNFVGTLQQNFPNTLATKHDTWTRKVSNNSILDKTPDSHVWTILWFSYFTVWFERVRYKTYPCLHKGTPTWVLRLLWRVLVALPSYGFTIQLYFILDGC